jgi:hypothetical protein
MFTNRAKLGLASNPKVFRSTFFLPYSSNDSRLHKRRVAFPSPKTLDSMATLRRPKKGENNMNLAVEIFTSDTKAWHSKHAISSPWPMGAARKRALPQAIAIMRLFSFFSSPLSFGVYFLCNDLTFIPKADLG